MSLISINFNEKVYWQTNCYNDTEYFDRNTLTYCRESLTSFNFCPTLEIGFLKFWDFIQSKLPAKND